MYSEKENNEYKTHPTLRVMEISIGFLRESDTVQQRDQRDQASEDMAMEVL